MLGAISKDGTPPTSANTPFPTLGTDLIPIIGYNANNQPAPANGGIVTQQASYANTYTSRQAGDVITGSARPDLFLFATMPVPRVTKADHITNFSSLGGDAIGISSSAFGIDSRTTISLTTITDASRLNAALATSNLFVYDQSSGNLYWNQDSTMAGFGSGGIFAVLENKAALSTSNISLV